MGVYKNKLNNWPIIAITIVTVLMVIRAPYLFINPRFWAEEGAVYFSEAFHTTWFDALLSGHQGHYSFFPNIITLIATKIVPLEYAPFVTTFAALVCQIFVVFIILYRLRSVLNPVQQLLLCVATIFVCNTGEIWLNTITSQYYFCLAAFFIVISGYRMSSTSWVIFDRFVLVISGLTSIITIFLLPALFIRWYLERDRNILSLNLITLSTTLVQLFYMLFNDRVNRVEFIGFYSFVHEWVVQFILWPIFGHNPGKNITGTTFLILIGVIIVAFLFVTACKTKNIEQKLAIVSFFSVSVFSLIGSLRMHGGWRYAYAPAVILMTVFILNLNVRVNKIIIGCSSIILIISFIFWIPSYRSKLSPWVVKTDVVWSKEVAKWRESSNYPLKISPQWEGKKWSVRLNADKIEGK